MLRSKMIAIVIALVIMAIPCNAFADTDADYYNQYEQYEEFEKTLITSEANKVASEDEIAVMVCRAFEEKVSNGKGSAWCKPYYAALGVEKSNLPAGNTAASLIAMLKEYVGIDFTLLVNAYHEELTKKDISHILYSIIYF